jgi:hypothetical protein
VIFSRIVIDLKCPFEADIWEEVAPREKNFFLY